MSNRHVVIKNGEAVFELVAESKRQKSYLYTQDCPHCDHRYEVHTHTKDADDCPECGEDVDDDDHKKCTGCPHGEVDEGVETINSRLGSKVTPGHGANQQVRQTNLNVRQLRRRTSLPGTKSLQRTLGGISGGQSHNQTSLERSLNNAKRRLKSAASGGIVSNSAKQRAQLRNLGLKESNTFWWHPTEGCQCKEPHVSMMKVTSDGFESPKGKYTVHYCTKCQGGIKNHPGNHLPPREDMHEGWDTTQPNPIDPGHYDTMRDHLASIYQHLSTGGPEYHHHLKQYEAAVEHNLKHHPAGEHAPCGHIDPDLASTYSDLHKSDHGVRPSGGTYAQVKSWMQRRSAENNVAPEANPVPTREGFSAFIAEGKALQDAKDHLIPKGYKHKQIANGVHEFTKGEKSYQVKSTPKDTEWAIHHKGELVDYGYSFNQAHQFHGGHMHPSLQEGADLEEAKGLFHDYKVQARANDKRRWDLMVADKKKADAEAKKKTVKEGTEDMVPAPYKRQAPVHTKQWQNLMHKTSDGYHICGQCSNDQKAHGHMDGSLHVRQKNKVKGRQCDYCGKALMVESISGRHRVLEPGEGDTVKVSISQGGGKFADKGTGVVQQVHQGINKMYTVKHPDGSVKRYGWQHVSLAEWSTQPQPNRMARQDSYEDALHVVTRHGNGLSVKHIDAYLGPKVHPEHRAEVIKHAHKMTGFKHLQAEGVISELMTRDRYQEESGSSSPCIRLPKEHVHKAAKSLEDEGYYADVEHHRFHDRGHATIHLGSAADDMTHDDAKDIIQRDHPHLSKHLKCEDCGNEMRLDGRIKHKANCSRPDLAKEK